MTPKVIFCPADGSPPFELTPPALAVGARLESLEKWRDTVYAPQRDGWLTRIASLEEGQGLASEAITAQMDVLTEHTARLVGLARRFEAVFHRLTSLETWRSGEMLRAEQAGPGAFEQVYQRAARGAQAQADHLGPMASLGNVTAKLDAAPYMYPCTAFDDSGSPLMPVEASLCRRCGFTYARHKADRARREEQAAVRDGCGKPNADHRPDAAKVDAENRAYFHIPNGVPSPDEPAGHLWVLRLEAALAALSFPAGADLRTVFQTVAIILLSGGTTAGEGKR